MTENPERQPEDAAGPYECLIEGQTFLICTEQGRHDLSGEYTGRWHAWCFFAYDRSLNIFPAGAVPEAVVAQESIAGESGASEDEARRAVEDRLRKVIQS